jgi:hypothetical protein
MLTVSSVFTVKFEDISDKKLFCTHQMLLPVYMEGHLFYLKAEVRRDDTSVRRYVHIDYMASNLS